ncbi:MAG: HAD family phosphatase [Alphaproteobacteria bacterium]|nr:HAD family phosphatase [Alphaproteobacteria bacterium]
MKSQYSAVVWDMDGTLIDTESIHEATLRSSCTTFGFKVFPHQHHVGLCMSQIWEAIGGTQQARISHEDWLEHLHLEFVKKTSLNKDYIRPGVKSVLETLSGFKISQACATNSPRIAIDFNMANLEIGHHFQHTLSRDDVKVGKPAPEIYLKASEKLGFSAKKCVAVEDTPVGIQAAKAAGMTAIAFPNQTPQNLDFSQADLIIENIELLLDFIGINVAA